MAYNTNETSDFPQSPTNQPDGDDDAKIEAIQFIEGGLRILDQTALPQVAQYILCSSTDQVIEAIKSMRVRGAPAIGAAGAAGIYLSSLHYKWTNERRLGEEEMKAFMEYMDNAKLTIDSSRPTAVNLSWATGLCIAALREAVSLRKDLKEEVSDKELVTTVLKQEVEGIIEEDITTNKAIGHFGAELIKHSKLVSPKESPSSITVIHHCNTGHLATCGHGTALGVVYSLNNSSENVHVYVDESRPRLQGARLTCWELEEGSIKHTLMVDGASGSLMSTKHVDAILFGADRCAANGDIANKIGTLNLCLVGDSLGVDRYACVPTSSIDLTIPSGKHIKIEERCCEEIATFKDKSNNSIRLCPQNTPIWNPAFDVTPNQYITAIITEVGVVKGPDFVEDLRKAKTVADANRAKSRDARMASIKEKLCVCGLK